VKDEKEEEEEEQALINTDRSRSDNDTSCPDESRADTGNGRE
jgi:hypothetical protein